jgi:hypothetical protein
VPRSFDAKMYVNCHTVHVDGTEKHERAMRGNPYHTDHTITPPPHNLLTILTDPD